jgi:hypothetical protein
MKYLVYIFIAVTLFSYVTDCGDSVKDPLPKIVQSLEDVSTASVILSEMRTEGDLSSLHFHKYLVLAEQKKEDGSPDLQRTQTDWLQVPEDVYKEREPLLGMTVYSKKEGQTSDAALPPGYQYVGDSRYGSWQRDSSGNQVWHWLAGYAMLSYLTGNRPIYDRDYRRYRQERSMGRGHVWYGPKDRKGSQSFGTKGTVTRNQRPDFYQRRMQKEASQKASFTDKVNNRLGRTSAASKPRSAASGSSYSGRTQSRVGRTSTPLRSRSGGRGK